MTSLHFLLDWCKLTQQQIKMALQSISLTKLNDEWLKLQVEKGGYTSKSELVNDLLRQARDQQVRVDWIRAKLDRAEKRGFTN